MAVDQIGQVPQSARGEGEFQAPRLRPVQLTRLHGQFAKVAAGFGDGADPGAGVRRQRLASQPFGEADQVVQMAADADAEFLDLGAGLARLNLAGAAGAQQGARAGHAEIFAVLHHDHAAPQDLGPFIHDLVGENAQRHRAFDRQGRRIHDRRSGQRGQAIGRVGQRGVEDIACNQSERFIVAHHRQRQRGRIGAEPLRDQSAGIVWSDGIPAIEEAREGVHKRRRYRVSKETGATFVERA